VFRLKLSLIIPLYNEESNVERLYSEIKYVFDNLSLYFNKLGVPDLARKYNDYEVIFIDDGSKDKTFEKLMKLKDKHVKIIKLRRNFGQSASWSAGFHLASGDVIVTMDGDLQNNPKDIPRLLLKLESGYDCVSGWRIDRKDDFFKRFFSRISNYLRHLLINDNVNDSGCSLKVYKKECLNDLELYGEMHRYITSLIKLKGYKIGEIRVKHRKRTNGKTKYSISRILKGFLDLINVWFWQKYSSRPLHLFGGTGILVFFMGIIFGINSVYLKYFRGVDLSDNFLAVLSIFLILVGIQLFFYGIQGDILLKNYHKLKGSRLYEIEKIVDNKKTSCQSA
jgi:glycosyltransferase involved in cell wall biosynthesis